MGTTATAIQGQSGVRLGFVLVIEGYKYLLTDGMPADAIAAWAGSSWTQALPGLEVSGGMAQKLEPWSNELPNSGMTFKIFGETFAVDMFKAKPSVRSELTVGFDTSTSGPGSFNLTVKDASIFAANEPVIIGNETYTVSGTPTGTSIPIGALGSGVYHPFGVDGEDNRFPGAHSIAPNVNVGNYEVNAPVYVSSTPATWLGKKVALHVHRISGGVWDSKSQSEVWFAGVIDSIDTDGPLATSIQCSGIQQQISDATLMHNQWSAKPRPGYTFLDGDTIRVRYHQLSGTTGSNVSAFLTAATPGTSADQFPSGRYTAQEFGAILAEHLDGDATIGVSGSAYTLRWSAYVFSSAAGAKFELVATEAAAVQGQLEIIVSNEAILRFLGFEDIWAPSDSNGSARKVGSISDYSQRVRLQSEQAPYRHTTFGLGSRGLTGSNIIDLEDQDGTFVDHTSLLPPSAQEFIGTGEVWSFYSIGDQQIFLGRRYGETQIAGITIDTPLSQMTHDEDAITAALREGSDRSLRIKQIFYACDSFASLVSKLFASTDGKGTNHADHDVFPFGAGIPWSLLGSTFTESLKALEQSGVEDSMALIVERPTNLWDAIKSDFALRMAAPVWKSGGLVIAQLSVPNASTATHVLDETNKSDTRDTVTSTVRDYLAHTVKIEYNRNPLTDKYTGGPIISRDGGAYQASGGAGATKTIKARNSYAGVAASGASVEALADMITARFLPILSRPLKRWTRSISHNLFHAAPGDTCVITDQRVRDPSTGELGIVSRAGTIMSVSYSLGISSGGQTYHGEVDVLFTEEDRLFPLAPSAEHASVGSLEEARVYASGWNQANTAMLLHQHSFSRTTASGDIVSFAVGDAVRVTELDPANPAAADTFVDTISRIETGYTTVAAINYDLVEFTNGFGVGGRVAFDSAKTYVIDFDSYTSCGASQILKTFLADDVGGLIEATAEPNLVADEMKAGTSVAADITLLPSRHAAEQFADGAPLSAATMRNLVRLGSNLTNYKTAPSSPSISQSNAIVSSSGSSEYVAIWTRPFFLGNERWPAGRVRKLNIAPIFYSGDGSSVTVRVTSSANPPQGSTYTDTTWFGPKKQISFSTTSLTLQVSTAQELDIVRSQDHPYMTYLTFEGNDLVAFRGAAELWLGPLQ